MTAPDLTAVISTHNRPVELREAIRAIRDQDHDGPIETVVVYDKAEPDLSLESDDPLRPVRVVRNHRTPGLPGSRNSGVDVASGPLVGFCDDDDLWLPAKASRQLELLERTGAPAVGCGIEIASPDRVVVRPSFGSAARFEDLIRARIPEASMATVLVRRDVFLDVIGPVDECIPGGFAEDYEWWLRATRHAPVPLVREPLFRVRWQVRSHFRDNWDVMERALRYVLEEFPEFRDDGPGLARIQGQRAFATAAQGRRGEALKLIGETVRANWRELRAVLALLVVAGVPAERVMAALNARGRGV